MRLILDTWRYEMHTCILFVFVHIHRMPFQIADSEIHIAHNTVQLWRGDNPIKRSSVYVIYPIKGVFLGLNLYIHYPILCGFVAFYVLLRKHQGDITSEIWIPGAPL